MEKGLIGPLRNALFDGSRSGLGQWSGEGKRGKRKVARGKKIWAGKQCYIIDEVVFFC